MTPFCGQEMYTCGTDDAACTLLSTTLAQKPHGQTENLSSHLLMYQFVQAAGSTSAAEQVIYVYQLLRKEDVSEEPSTGVCIHRSPALLRMCFRPLAHLQKQKTCHHGAGMKSSEIQNTELKAQL